MAILLMAVLVVGLAAVGVWQLLPEEKEEADQLSSIIGQFVAPPAEHADPANCIECHRKATEAWQGSHHHLANAPLSATDRERLQENRGDLLRERGIRWHHGGPVPVLEEPGLPPYPVVGSIGLTPLIQYLHLAPDGRLQAHDVAWDAENDEWFSVFERDDADAETPRQPGEWGHWTGQGMNWDANCAYCHMTEYHKGYDFDSDTYTREWTAMGITCAQCHPNMDVHLAQIRNNNNYFKEGFNAEQIMEYCATCHSRREELTAERFVAGDEYEDHYNLTLASVPGIYHPDGQVIGENYVYGSLMMSKMGHAGVTCMDCHNPHTNGHILPFENNALCQRCHGSGLRDAPRINPTAHSHHPAESTGNRCVECHMPVTHFMGRDGRRDHSFSHPDPQLTLEMGIPNACTGCHNTQSVEWSKRYNDEWYGPDMNADRRKKARLMRDLFDSASGTGPRLRAAIDEEKNRFWKATFLSMLPYLEPDPGNLDRLVAAAANPDPMIRAAAVRTAGLQSLPEYLRAGLLKDPYRSVRISATLATPGLTVSSDDHEAELREYLHHTSDSPMGALRYSAYWRTRGQPEMARAAARKAVEFEPLNPEAWRLAAVELHSMGESDEALEYLDKALQIDPASPMVLFNLGLLQYEQGNTNAALTRLNEAVMADPRYESAWYNLIVLYWQLNERQAALSRLERALGHLPDSRRLQQLAGQLR